MSLSQNESINSMKICDEYTFYLLGLNPREKGGDYFQLELRHFPKAQEYIYSSVSITRIFKGNQRIVRVKEILELQRLKIAFGVVLTGAKGSFKLRRHSSYRGSSYEDCTKLFKSFDFLVTKSASLKQTSSVYRALQRIIKFYLLTETGVYKEKLP